MENKNNDNQKNKNIKRSIKAGLCALLLALIAKGCDYLTDNKDNDVNPEIDPDVIEEITDGIIDGSVLGLDILNRTPFFDYGSVDLSPYDGDSLIEGLRECGYDDSFPFRKGLADYYGIDDYIGTPEQDKELLDIIRDKDKDKEEEPSLDDDQDKNKDDINKPIVDPSKDKDDVKPPVSGGDGDEKPPVVHEHDYETKITYKSYMNGQHAKVTTKTCKICKDGVVRSINENCTFTEWSYDSKLDKDVRECMYCHYKEQREHVKDPDQHTHDYKIVRCDSKYEYLECSCGHTMTREHSLGDLVKNPDGSMSYPCLNDGCDYARAHIHTVAKSIETVKSTTVCYQEVGTCSDCGEEIYRTDVGHNDILVESGKKKDIMACSVCGREIEVDKIPVVTPTPTPVPTPEQTPEPTPPEPTPVVPVGPVDPIDDVTTYCIEYEERPYIRKLSL